MAHLALPGQGVRGVGGFFTTENTERTEKGIKQKTTETKRHREIVKNKNFDL
jgi:hypothetical protein